MSLSIENLSIYHAASNPPANALLTDFNLNIESSEIVTLMGPSGCGKSTLLNVIAGHLSSDFQFTGEVFLGGDNILHHQPHLRSIGILFQDDLLFPHLSIWENVAFALPNNIKGKQRKIAAIEALHSIKLDGLAHSMPQQVSGGQRARVSLLRMLCAKPKAVLLDEPFNQLDPELRPVFRDWVFQQLSDAHIPTLMVTHDLTDAPHNSRVINWNELVKEPNHA